MSRFFIILLMASLIAGCSVTKTVSELAGGLKGGSKGSPSPNVLVVVINGDKDNNIEINGAGVVTKPKKEDGDSDEKESNKNETEKTNSEKEQTKGKSGSPSEVSSDTHCGVYVPPKMPDKPELSNISPELKSDPEALANVLIDHILELNDYISKRNATQEESYREYLKSCR